MRILIAGASGAIGRALVRRLRANQHEVFALTQSRDSAAVLKEIGAEPVIADALDAAAVKAAVGQIRPDAVINELTSLPCHYTPAEMNAAAQSAQDTISVNSRRVSMMSSRVCGDQSASSRTIRGRCNYYPRAAATVCPICATNCVSSG
jgi:nucleoside-diphosphate-sugar epimerase